MRVLVVDDNLLIRRILRDTLEAEGFECVEASDIRTATSALERESPEVCFLDLHLPDGDAFAVLEHWRTAGPPRAVRIYLLTGSDEAGLATRAVQLGARGVLTKPWTRLF